MNVVHGYLTVWFRYKGYLAHRLIWALVYGQMPTLPIDHINGVRHDNRLSNLRLATVAQNTVNTGVKPSNKLGLKGVYFNKRAGKYATAIRFAGRRRHLGVFDNAEQAHEFYCLAADLAHGEFANHG